MSTVKLTVNGKQVSGDAEDRTLLVQFLRDHLGLTGTHVGCDTSQCGACVVHIDGAPVKSCTTFAVQANGATITTIEGMARNGEYDAVQMGFWEMHGLQCGYCTPGMIMNAAAFLDRNPNPTEAEIRHSLEGNICRCTGYQNIVKAIQFAADQRRGMAKKPGDGTDLSFEHEQGLDKEPENTQEWGDQVAGEES